MSLTSPDSSLATVPLPSEEDLIRVIGMSYDSDKTLNVMKMFAGTQSTLARNLGLSPQEIRAAASDNAIERIDAEYRLAWKATDKICIEGTLCDETLYQLLARYGETVTRKLILIISWFNLLSCFISGCRVPLEVADKIGNKAAPIS
jgi:hypothetical protein